MITPIRKSIRMWPSVLVIAMLAGIAVVQPQARADSSKTAPVVAFRPVVNARVDVDTPDGSARQYPTTTGTTIWGPDLGLPIVKGDKIKLNVFVSTGAYELSIIKVRLDNVPYATISTQPWSTTIDTNTLDLGYHSFEIWAQSGSPAPYSSGEQNIMVYVAATPPAGTAVKSTTETTTTPAGTSTGSTPTPDAGTNPATPVTGQAMSSGMTQTAGTPDPSAPITTPAVPVLPALLTGMGQSAANTLSMQVGTAAGEAEYATGKPVTLTEPLDVTINVPHGSLARTFVYALYRNDQIVYESNQFLPVSATKIQLQPRNGAAPGLLPGDITLKAWGVDTNKQYGPATTMDIDIPVTGTEESVK